jgi:hypothetical protein
MTWPSLSADLTSLDFGWGSSKDQVCAISCRTIEVHVEQLEVPVIAVDVSMLRCVGEYNLLPTAVSPEMDGGRFEHHLTTRRL